jgi:hypothetical protein
MKKEVVRTAAWLLVWLILFFLNPSPNICPDPYLMAGPFANIERQ